MMDLIDVLKASGFQEDAQDEKYVRSLGDGYVVEAYKNGSGVIFHLVKDGTLVQITIQTIDYTDLVTAINQLKNFLQLFVVNLSNNN